MSQDILHTEVFEQYSALVQDRRARLNAVTTGLPGSLWALVILGSIISIIIIWFFDARSFWAASIDGHTDVDAAGLVDFLNRNVRQPVSR